MRTLIFSDTHLSNTIDEKKYNLLEYLIKRVDRVIINGDFWEGAFTTFSEFLDSPYRTLFPLLKKKHTVYLPGNHDKKEWIDERVNLFVDTFTDRYEFPVNGKSIVMEHGNRLYPIFGKDSRLLEVLGITQKTVDTVERLVLQKGGKTVRKLLFGEMNRSIKKKIKKELRPHQVFICGHTHLAEFDLQKQFINTGFIRHGLGQYVIIENDKIIPKEEWYE